MSVRVVRHLIAVALMSALLGASPLAAQSGDPKSGEKARNDAAAMRDAAARKAAELSEIAKHVTGPAGNPECIWLGRRVVNLLWRDDLDTAFRHLDLYDRFGCPSGHIQATFRCVVLQGNIDPKVAESLHARVNACWMNPATEPTPPAAAANPAQSGGTTTQ